MENKQPPTIALEGLEERIDALVQVCQGLYEENKSLKAQQADLLKQRNALINKTETAKARVEGMISRLKMMEF